MLSSVGVTRCVVGGCGAMASTGAKKRTLGTDSVEAPMAHGSQPLLGGAEPMQALLPVSPHAETMHAFGIVLGDPMMDDLLQPDILRKVRLEFDKYRPMLEVLTGCKSAGCASETMQKDMVQVEHAAGIVYDWLCYDSGAVLGYLQVLSLRVLPYSVEFVEKVAVLGYLQVRVLSDGAAAIDPMRMHPGAATITKSRDKSTTVARRFLGELVVGLYYRMLRCASVQTDDDSSDGEFGPASVVDGFMPPQSAFGRRYDTFACYRQLHADASHAHSVEFEPSVQ